MHVVVDLMQDLIREISSLVSSLSADRIPPYLFPLNLVEQNLKIATTTVVQPFHVQLANSGGSAILISVNTQNLEIGFILNLLIIEEEIVCRLKSVLIVGF